MTVQYDGYGVLMLCRDGRRVLASGREVAPFWSGRYREASTFQKQLTREGIRSRIVKMAVTYTYEEK